MKTSCLLFLVHKQPRMRSVKFLDAFVIGFVVALLTTVAATPPNWGGNNPASIYSSIGSTALTSSGGSSGFTASLNPSGTKLFLMYQYKQSANTLISVAVYDRNSSRTVFNQTPINIVPVVTAVDNIQDPSFMTVVAFSDDSFVATIASGPNILYVSTAYNSVSSSYSVASSTTISNAGDYYYPAGQSVLSDVLLLPTEKVPSTTWYQGLTAVARSAATKVLQFSSNITYGTSASVKPCRDTSVPANTSPFQYAMSATSSHIIYVCGACAGVGPACNGNYNISLSLRAFSRLSSAIAYNFSATPSQTQALNIGRTLPKSSEALSTSAEIFLNSQWIGIYINAGTSSGSYQTALFVYNRTSNVAAPFQTAVPVLSNAAIGLPAEESATAPKMFSFGGTYLAFKVNDAKTAIYVASGGSFPNLQPPNRVALLDPASASSGATVVPNVVLQGDVPYALASYLVNSPQANNRLIVYAQNSCPPGNALIRSGTSADCQPCAPGTTNNIGSETCTTCVSPLQYAPTPSMQSCQDCPVGHVSVTNRTLCTACLPGTFLDSQQGQCLPCSAGTSQDRFAQTTCGLCVEGSYQPSKGTTSCILCPVGTYNSETGKRSCSRCEAGYFSNVTGRTSIDDCSPCDLGSFAPTSGSSSCSACPAGTYGDRLGLSSCFQCAVGTYLTRTGGNSSTMCVSCPVGTYGAASGSKACLKCPPGTYSDEKGSSSCKTCPSDYRNTASGLTSQTACDAPNTSKIMLYSVVVAGFSSLLVAFAGLIFNRYFLGIKLLFFKFRLRQARKKCEMYREYVRMHDVPNVFSNSVGESTVPDASKKVHPNVIGESQSTGVGAPVASLASPRLPPIRHADSGVYSSHLASAPSIVPADEVYDGIAPGVSALDRAEEFYDENAKVVRILEFQRFTQQLQRAARPFLSFCISLFFVAGFVGSLVGVIIFSILLAQENSSINQADEATSSTTV